MIGAYKGHPLKLTGKRKKSYVVGLPSVALSGLKRARDISAYMNKGYKGLKTLKKPKTASITQVITKRTREGKQYEEGGNSLSRCHFGTLPCYVSEPVLRTLAKQINVYNAAASNESTVGKQAVFWYTYSQPSDLLAHLASVNEHMIFHGVNAEVSLVNSSSTNSTLYIYDIICKRDCNSSNTGSPNGAWQVGVDDAGGSSTDYQVIGSIPTESKLFTEYYKIVQQTRVSLGPGQMHRHAVSYYPNKILSGELLNNCTYGVAGVTIGTMVVHYGMPAHDSTTTTNVTIDVSALDIAMKYSHDWRALENATTTWNKTNNLATSFAVGEQFVNEAVGQVQDSGGLHPGTLHT